VRQVKIYPYETYTVNQRIKVLFASFIQCVRPTQVIGSQNWSHNFGSNSKSD